jgi:hypothetical protein
MFNAKLFWAEATTGTAASTVATVADTIISRLRPRDK